MRYLGFLIVAAAVFQLLTFARYSWGEGNKTAAAGAVLLALVTAIIPGVALLIVDYSIR